MKPRGLLLTVDYAPQTGGVPLLVSTIVDRTRDRIDWRVVTCAMGGEEDHVVRTRSLRGLAREAWAQRRWLEERDPRIVISAHPYLGPVAHGVARAARCPVSSLVYGRELVPERPQHRVALSTLRRDHRVVTISRHSEELVADLGVAAHRREWIGPQLRPQFPPVSPPRRRSAGTPLELVTVTRLAEGYKNLEVLARAMAVLVANKTVGRLTIVGDGPRRAALEARVRHMGLSSHIHLPGRLSDDDLATTLMRSHVGVFSSRHAPAEGGFEGFGIVVQELAAAGLPVVVGDAAGAKDAAATDWAIMVDPDDVRAWVAAIQSLGDDEDHRFALAERAHEWGRALDSTAMAHDYLDALLEDLGFPQRPEISVRRGAPTTQGAH